MSQTQIWQLVARKLSGEAGLDELKQLEQLLLEDPELAYKVDLYCRYFEKPPAATRRTETEKQKSLDHLRLRFAEAFAGTGEDALKSLPEPYPQKRTVSMKKWLSAAAVFVCLAATVFFVYDSKKQPAGTGAIAAQEVNEVNTMPGTRSKTVLPDGTIVWLNSDSRISYNTDFGKTKREIILTGEAFFDVAHNEAVPMIVHAKSVNIVVKGTAFNVRCYPGSTRVQTSLIRGSVELSTRSKPDEKILLKPNEKITIDLAEEANNRVVNAAPEKVSSAGQKSYHIDHLKQSSLTPVIPEVSWIENRLVFDNEAFTDVIDKMEKWYNVDIVLTNKRLEGKKFSGAFEKENISEALSALQFINHFNFEIKGSKVIIQ